MTRAPKLCAWAGCQSTEITVTLSWRREAREGFCCGDHAAFWLIARAHRHTIAKSVERFLNEPQGSIVA